MYTNNYSGARNSRTILALTGQQCVTSVALFDPIIPEGVHYIWLNETISPHWARRCALCFPWIDRL